MNAIDIQSSKTLENIKEWRLFNMGYILINDCLYFSTIMLLFNDCLQLQGGASLNFEGAPKA